VKDGDFDRLRIPMGNGSGGPAVAETDSEQGDADDPVEEAQRLGVAATPTQLAAGSAVVAGLILVGLAAFRRRRGGSRDQRDGAA
jgi:hypothetical protein